MPSGKARPERKSQRESGEDSEDESEVLEESPCGRWLKRREEFCPLFPLMRRRYHGPEKQVKPFEKN
ncbi:hypothetical protein GE061_018136 [Apolygus lucorum]|uniref:Uncharacterized protein n=1 Tax=Apolygus lucorum TaxID=248454 RepID=A0A6A4IS72_APOLU|nr:hypothetical protein GE061_018136 [Apolygus lucorum]